MWAALALYLLLLSLVANILGARAQTQTITLNNIQLIITGPFQWSNSSCGSGPDAQEIQIASGTTVQATFSNGGWVPALRSRPLTLALVTQVTMTGSRSPVNATATFYLFDGTQVRTSKAEAIPVDIAGNCYEVVWKGLDSTLTHYVGIAVDPATDPATTTGQAHLSIAELL